MVVNYEKLRESVLSPNEVFLLYDIAKKIKMEYVHLCNTDYMIEKEYITEEMEITGEGLKVLKSVMDFTPEVRKWMHVDELAALYKELFPKGIKSGGYPVRSSTSNISKKLVKFRREHPHISDELILEATKRYIEKQKLGGYQYIKLAEYLIYKENTSMLATLCEELGEEEENVSWGRSI